jgi:hypothetical protein
MLDTLIVKFNSDGYGSPLLTVGRIDPVTEQLRLTANYSGEMAVDIYNILTHEFKEEEVGEKSND